MLTAEELSDFRRSGFLFLPPVLKADEISALKREIAAEVDRRSAGMVMEADASTVRALHGSHKSSLLMDRLCRLAPLRDAAKQIINDEVYVYQFKVNIKERLSGERWPWHRDYPFWKEEDGMPAPLALNVAILVDEALSLNGPLCFIPGSHLEDKAPLVSASGEGWRSHVSSNLKYTIPDDEVVELCREGGIVPFIGAPGSVAIFDSRVAHASPCNITTMSRKMVIITYNAIRNAPLRRDIVRPDFLVEANPVAIGDHERTEGLL